MKDKLLGDPDDPFRPGDLVLEWLILIQGLIAILFTVVDFNGMISVKQQEWRFVFGILLGVNLIVSSGVMRRLRK
jgi:hypothetical protein